MGLLYIQVFLSDIWILKVYIFSVVEPKHKMYLNSELSSGYHVKRIFMNKIIIPLIFIVLLSGCGITGIFNLAHFILPDDVEFIEVVEALYTPLKIVDFMAEHFTPLEPHDKAFSPYEMWQVQEGDCNDFCCFAMFCASYHGYEVYQLLIIFPDFSHVVCVYKIDDGYLVSDVGFFHQGIFRDFQEIAEIFNGWESYKVFDYEMNEIESDINEQLYPVLPLPELITYPSHSK